MPPGGGGMVRPPAGTTRGPVGGVPVGAGVGAPDAGRGAGEREVMLAPGRDDTTRGAPPAGAAVGVGATGVAGAGDDAAAGAVTAGAAGADTSGADTTGATGADTTGADTTGVDTTGVGGASSLTGVASLVFARDVRVDDVFFGLGSASSAFLAFFGFSAGASRFNPCASTWRRRRSACGSTMLDDAEVAPMPIELHRSTTSLEVRPSSLASAETRTFLLKPSGPPQLGPRMSRR